jgi:hypothetical protein
MKRAIVVFILVFFAAVQVNAWTIEHTNLAIHSSGKTRMLAMKMSKLYGVQALNNYPIGKKQLAQRDLVKAKTAMDEFYKALLAFEPVATNAELAEQVKTAQSSWIELEKLLSKPPSKTGFLDVLEAGDVLLDKNEIMTSYMESLSPVPMSEIINMAVRQQMYAMKLSRDYLAAYMDIDKEYRIDLMLDAAIEFESAMLMMEGATENTAKINGLIKSITKMEWKKVYETATECIESNGEKFNILMMVKFCDTLLGKTERLAGLYVVVSDDNVAVASDNVTKRK